MKRGEQWKGFHFLHRLFENSSLGVEIEIEVEVGVEFIDSGKLFTPYQMIISVIFLKKILQQKKKQKSSKQKEIIKKTKRNY